MYKTAKIFLFCLLSINLTSLLLSAFLSYKIIRAQSIPLTQNARQNAIPTPYVPCNEVRPTIGNPSDRSYFSDEPLSEFHSLRPYQASPCIETTPPSQMAISCGNDIYIRSNIVISMDGGSFNISPPDPATRISPENCDINLPSGTQTCSFVFDRNINISSNLSQLNLPALGNTQNVRNIKNADLITRITTKEQIDDPQKVNNYLTWYLSGILYKPEYTYPFPNPLILTSGFFGENRSDFQRMVDYSGPLNKLLPQRIQYSLRERQIDAAIGNTTQNQTSFSDATPRHNQVVICTIGFNFVGLFQLGNFPIPCNTKADLLINYMNYLRYLGFPNIVTSRGYRIGYWQNQVRKPPKEENFTSFTDYFLAVNKWRGQICSSIRLPATGESPWDQFIPSALRGIGINICYNDPMDLVNSIDPTRPESNLIDAEFFSYIPYSSTEDRIGQIGIEISSDPVGQDMNVQVLSRSLQGKTSSVLYLPHIQASEEMAEVLQSKFVPFDLPKKTSALKRDIFVDVDPRFAGTCQAVEARESPVGDSVFADDLSFTLSYRARVSRCVFPLPPEDATSACINAYAQLCQQGDTSACSASPECVPSGSYTCNSSASTSTNPNPCGANYTCGSGCSTSLPTTCRAVINHTLDANIQAPLLDSVWSRLVAGPTSVFRRMMPKVGMNSFLRQIWDLPGSAYVSYSSLDQGVSLASGKTDVWDASKSEIYFPHVGGIYEYFLKCMQTSLRPKKDDGSISVCLPPIATTGSRPPIPAPLCTTNNPQTTTTPTPTQSGGTSPGTFNTISEADLINLLSAYGLQGFLKRNDAINLYNSRFSSTNSANLNARISALELLKAERDLISMGFTGVKRYITTAWIWYESGSSYWPDPYLYNCDDGDQAPNPSNRAEREVAAYDISNYCTKIKPDSQDRDFLIQVAGFQATEPRKKYREIFTKIYGNDNVKLREVLKEVVAKSSRASRSLWNYNNANLQGGLTKIYLPDLLSPSSIQPVTLQDIEESGNDWSDKSPNKQRSQFFTFMLGKDPKMAIYLNTNVPDPNKPNERVGGVTGGNIVIDTQNTQNKTRLANMIYALWLLETNQGANMPLGNIATTQDTCVEPLSTLNFSNGIKHPLVSATNDQAYLSFNNEAASSVTLSTKDASEADFTNSYNVAQARDLAYLNAVTYIDNQNLYFLWADHAGMDTIFLKKISLNDVANIASAPTLQVASGPDYNSYISHPRFVVDGNLIVVTWNEAGRVKYAVSNDGGNSWSQILTASQFEVYGTMPPEVAKSKSGEISFVYGAAGNEFGNVYMMRFDRSSNTFTDHVLVAQGPGGQYDYAYPSHVYDSNGYPHVVFADIGNGRVSRIYVASRMSNDWNADWNIEVVSDSTGIYGRSSISADDNGGLHVFWVGNGKGYYTFKTPFGVWGHVYSADGNLFLANSDNAVSTTPTGTIMHGVAEGHANGEVKVKYFLFRNK